MWFVRMSLMAASCDRKPPDKSANGSDEVVDIFCGVPDDEASADAEDEMAGAIDASMDGGDATEMIVFDA